MTRTSALRVVRLSAIYDVLVTAAFALPWTAVPVLDGLARAHHALGLAGTAPASTDPYTVMFAGFTGSLVTVWAAVRLWRTSLALGAADSVARVLFAAAMGAALANGASHLVVGFLVPELLWCGVQATAVLRARRASARPPALLRSAAC
ncbi:hypothetical protein [Myceligenerans indicum]|uniref:DUF4345 domain-containing protein n=1 Tax=Myceligenerans indicum TaxID=2593663 RepID=A0ABS1LRH8_9MICO|nr:hypothetical protein [Myceligenerans indicum]MBL0888810.1 hypothetical protein [Myceligenerans indicum]